MSNRAKTLPKQHILTLALFLFVSTITSAKWTDWGQWHNNPCFPQIKYRVKYQLEANSSGSREYKVQFHNTFGHKIYFNYEMVPMSERSAMEASGRTTNRTDLEAGAKSKTDVFAHFAYLKTNGEIFVYINKLHFGKDHGDYAECGDTGPRSKPETTKPSSSLSTIDCAGCTPDQIAQKRSDYLAKKKEEAAQREVERQRKAQEDQRKREAEQAEVKKAKEEERKKREKEYRQAQQSEQEQEMARIREQERAEQRERERKAQQYQQRQIQTQSNMEDAAALGVAALLVHYYLGKIIYAAQNTAANASFQDWASNFNLRFGYGVSNHNLYINKQTLTYGNSSTRIGDMFTLDFNLGMEWEPISSKNIGFGTFADIYAGHGLLFTHFKWGYSYGFKTHLGPIGYNYRMNGVEIMYDDWIDADAIAEEKAKGLWGRHEIGLAIRRPSYNVDLLYLISPNNPVVDDKNYSHGIRFEYFQPNKLRYYVEATEVPRVLGTRSSTPENEDRFPSVIKAGIIKNFNYYGNSYANNYNKVALFKHLDSKTWYMNFAIKSSGGDMLIGGGVKDTMQRTTKDISYQATIEKEFKIIPHMYASVGGGATLFKGFNGIYRATGQAINQPISMGNLNFSSFSVDFPIGLVFNSEPLGRDYYSIFGSMKTDIVIPVGYSHVVEKDASGYNTDVSDELDGLRKGVYTTIKYEAGLEYYISTRKKFRWSVLMEFPLSSTFEGLIDYSPYSVGMKAGINL